MPGRLGGPLLPETVLFANVGKVRLLVTGGAAPTDEAGELLRSPTEDAEDTIRCGGGALPTLLGIAGRGTEEGGAGAPPGGPLAVRGGPLGGGGLDAAAGPAASFPPFLLTHRFNSGS